ncbi:hypothetical protein CDL15_Pgr003599 [Punica granatum]|uniref:Uncharacterized protein n=1 Tax=Punica granatum TaxID=22663 RepID=A0A218XT24_PUNGR|nr:hypothetical protein CDL15_Pgr003599 [Punica granatum]
MMSYTQVNSADLNETIKKIKRTYREHSSAGQNMGQQEGSSAFAPQQLESRLEPTGSEWGFISTDAAWNVSRSCLSGVLQQPNRPPALS